MPPFGSPTADLGAGMGAPSPLGGIIGQLLTLPQKLNEHRQQQEQEKLQRAQQGSQIYQIFGNLLKQNPALANDPNTMKSLEDASKGSGLPSPVRPGGAPMQTPSVTLNDGLDASGKPKPNTLPGDENGAHVLPGLNNPGDPAGKHIDMNMLGGGDDFAKWSPQDIQQFMAMDPLTRKAIVKSRGTTNIDEELLNHPRVATQAEINNTQTNYQKALHDVGTGNMAPGAFIQYVQSNSENLSAAHIDPQQILNDPTVLGQMSAALQLKRDRLTQLGVKDATLATHYNREDATGARNANTREGQLGVSRENANSMAGLRKSYGALADVKASWTPAVYDSEIKLRQKQGQAATERADSYAKRVQNLNTQAKTGNTQAIAALRAATSSKNDVVRDLQASLGGLRTYANQLTQDGHDITDPNDAYYSVGQQIEQLQGKVSDAQNSLAATDKEVTSYANNATSSTVGSVTGGNVHAVNGNPIVREPQVLSNQQGQQFLQKYRNASAAEKKATLAGGAPPEVKAYLISAFGRP